MRFTRHEESKEHLKTFNFLMDSYEGGDDYREGKYLFKRELEDDKTYADRLVQAAFDNMCAPVTDIYTSYLMNSKIGRDFGDLSGTVFEDFLRDADYDGRSYEAYWRANSRMASIQGLVGTLVDKPTSDALTKADEIAGNIRPYYVTYKAPSIYDWKYERRGGKMMLTYLVLEEDSDVKDIEQFRVWDLESWAVWHQKKDGSDAYIYTDEDGKENSGVNPLGEIPFVPLKNLDTLERMEGRSDIGDIAELNRRIYNIDSDIDQIRGRAALPFLQIPKMNGSEETVVISLSTVFEFDPEAANGKASWLEPNLNSIDACLNQRTVSVDGIRMIAKLGGDSGQSARVESGISLEIRFQQLNALLNEKAEMMKNAEERCLRFYAMWEGNTEGETDAVITYPSSYGVRDLSADIDNAIKAKTLIQSKTFSVEKSMEIVTAYLNDPSQETIDKIMAELEGAKTIDLLNVDSNGSQDQGA